MMIMIVAIDHVIDFLEIAAVVVTMTKVVLIDVSYLLKRQIESSIYLLNEKQLAEGTKNPAQAIDYLSERKQRKRVVGSFHQKIGNVKGSDIF